MKFLRDHAKTLEELSLTEVALSLGHWADVFNGITQITDLRRLQLKHLFHVHASREGYKLDATITRDGKIDFAIFRHNTNLRIHLSTHDYSLGQILTGRGCDQSDSNMKCLNWWLKHGPGPEEMQRRHELSQIQEMPMLHLCR